MRTAPAKAASVRCVRQACRHRLWAAEETARQNWSTAEGPYQDITDLYIRSRVSQADATIAPTTSWVRQCHSELVSVLQVLFQSRRLQVARRLPMASVLVKELENFRVKITVNANETFESWRERDHDDLVLAVAMATWLGERVLQEFWIR